MLLQNTSMRQQLSFNPRQIAQLAIFQLDQLSLEQRIQNELADNPFLEEVTHTVTENPRSPDEAIKECESWEDFRNRDTIQHFPEFNNNMHPVAWAETNVTDTSDYREDMKDQLSFLPINQSMRELCCFIIDSCDEKGFLESDVETIAESYRFETQCGVTRQMIETAISTIQQLDPQGVGCKDIFEYFRFQLERVHDNSPLKTSALKLITYHSDDIRAKRWKQLQKSVAKDGIELNDSLEYLKTLKNYPVEVPANNSNNIVPDVNVFVEEDQIAVSLTAPKIDSLKVSDNLPLDIANKDNKEHKDARRFIRQKVQAAEWFIDAIRQREQNLLTAVKAIVWLQRDYFLTGEPMTLKPMILKNIADKTKQDISTISRLVANKYIATPFGTFGIKKLFSEGIPTQSGEIVSSRVVELKLETLIESEDKKRPLTDQMLADILAHKGFIIARRTIAKYREKLNIPVCKLRAAN